MDSLARSARSQKHIESCTTTIAFEAISFDRQKYLCYKLNMIPKLRIARSTNHLQMMSDMYRDGLGLEVLGKFDDHEGFDGVMIGSPQCPYHFEFTQEAGQMAPRCPSFESLLIFYYSDPIEWSAAKNRMSIAGFTPVRSHNPYWDKCGCTFEDPEGYRVVLCNREWKL